MEVLKIAACKGNSEELAKSGKSVEKCHESSCTYDTFCTEAQNLWQELERGFQNVKQLEPVLVFMSFLFAEVDTKIFYNYLLYSTNVSDLEEEMLKLQLYTTLKVRA